MNVFDFAMQMEKDGKSFYEKMAKKTGHEGLRTIFKRLADDEQKHFEIFQSLKNETQATAMEDSTVLEEAKNVFETLPAEKGKVLGKISDDLEGYRYAMKIEADSARLYEDAAQREKREDVRNLLQRIAAEEHKHFTIIENIYQFVNAPNDYLAWREFSNLDEFHQFGRDVDT